MATNRSLPSANPSQRAWETFSPAGLRVLAVDDDKLCLKVIAKMLQQCNYEVETCSSSNEALRLLRERHKPFDLVLSDVVMPDIDGFKLLEVVGLEMDIPVIMMSYDGDTNTVLKGVTHGAVDFLIKPVRLEELSNMWQHVVRKRRQQAAEAEGSDLLRQTCSQSGSDMDAGENMAHRGSDACGTSAVPAGAPLMLPGGTLMGASELAAAPTGGVGPEGSSPSAAATETRKRGSMSDDREGGAASAPQPNAKRPRVHWTSEMHSQFVAAVNKLGIDKAVPKKILELMTVEGLTRENVASHLQKYRLYLKKAARMDPNAMITSTAAAGHAGNHAGTAGSVGSARAQAAMVMPALQHMAQVHPAHMAGMQQGVYAGMPAGYMPHPPWPQAMMAGMPQSMAPATAYGQHMQQMSPLMGQPVSMSADANSAPAGVPFAPQLAGQSVHGPGQLMQASSLPPLAPEHAYAGAGEGLKMEEDLDLRPCASDAVVADGLPGDTMAGMGGLGALDGSLPDDGGDIGHIPEEMEEFLSILAKEEAIEG